jgi:hypothetical protein
MTKQLERVDLSEYTIVTIESTYKNFIASALEKGLRTTPNVPFNRNNKDLTIFSQQR